MPRDRKRLIKSIKKQKHQKQKLRLKKTEYEESLPTIDDERKQVLSEARKSANEEYVKIVEDANVKARQINEEAKQNAQNQKEQILKSVEGEIADMVVDATSKIVAGKTDNKALYDEFLNKAGDN